MEYFRITQILFLPTVWGIVILVESLLLLQTFRNRPSRRVQGHQLAVKSRRCMLYLVLSCFGNVFLLLLSCHLCPIGNNLCPELCGPQHQLQKGFLLSVKGSAIWCHRPSGILCRRGNLSLAKFHLFLF